MAILTKSSQYPFISWLPAAINAPTPISALVHSRTLVTAGLFLALKFKWVILGSWVLLISGLVGIMTLLVGSWAALWEADLKKIVAFSTIRQLGFLLWIFSNGSLILVLFHLVSHAFFKRSLFIGVGTIIFQRFGDQSKRVLRAPHLNSIRQISWLYLTLLNLSSFPFLVGFYSKEENVLSLIRNQTFCYIRFLWVSLRLTLAYSYRLFKGGSLFGVFKIRENKSFSFIIFGASFIIFPLLFLGWVWSLNLFLPQLGLSTWGVSLLVLLLGAILNLNFSIFYFIINFLKISLSFLKMGALNLESFFHFYYLLHLPAVILKWNRWVILLRVFLFFFL